MSEASPSRGRSPSSGSGAAVGMLVAIALIGLGVYLNLRGDGDAPGAVERSRDADAGEPGAQAPAKRNPRSTIAKLRVEPSLVELGAVTTCAPPREFEFTIFNDGSGPALVQGWASSCGCLVPAIESSIDLAPGDSRRVRVSLEPWGIGDRRQSLALRLEGGVPGPSIEVTYRIEAPVWPRPAMVNRPEGRSVRVVDLERSAPDGSFLAEPFEVLGVVPLVAEAGPSLGDGHASIAVDFDRIDALASDPALARDAGFTWREERGETRWKTLDLRIRTSVESCAELVIRVRNR